ncbi:Alpha/Beta hydrolase protein [Armillaria mellea]|nr:Alpha/Beta hydrolase protein [Armillaria mellea]
MSSPILAGPLGECCFKAVKHEGTPVGRTDIIAGVPTYVSEPSSANKTVQKTKVILYFADVYGPLHINNQLVQDYFASQGFIVVGIDYFLGDSFGFYTELDFDRETWIEKSRQKALELTPRWLDAIREQYGKDSQYLAVGYCFGAPLVLDLAIRGDIVAGAIAHPGFLTEDHFRNIKKPLFLSCAEYDITFPLENRRRAEDILVEVKASYCFQIFSGVEHGFALRGDPNVGDTRWAKEESARGITNWFQRFCVEDS